MKMRAIAAGVLAGIFLVSGIHAECLNPPKDGTYSTYSGTMLGGRASEAWCSGVGPGQPGNTESTASWDGSTLGAQWRVWGMAIDANGAVETARSFDADGNGWIDYATNYTGGSFWLDGNHLWGNGIGDFTGVVTYFQVTARVTYVRWQAVGVTSNVFMTAGFDECPNCSIEYAISSAMLEWQTGYPTPMPSGYPAFACDATMGELFDASCCVLAKIHCTPIAAESSTWGAIKGFYR
jgi:hypothetical protein